MKVTQRTGHNLVYVTAGPVQPLGAAPVDLEIDGRSYLDRAIIVKTSRLDLLIGTDVLHQI